MITPSSVLAPCCIGRSLEGRLFVVDRFGMTGPILLVVAAIYGNEHSAVTAAERLRARLLGGWAERRDVRVALVGSSNPDGIAAHTRENARGIDLNRNFPADNFQSEGARGDQAKSEPETRALVELIDIIAPHAVVALHCCEPMLDYDGDSRDMARVMHESMPRDVRFLLGRLGSQPGSMGSWVGFERDTPIVTLEFAAADKCPLLEQYGATKSALDAAMRWLSRRHTGGDDTSQPWPDLPRDGEANHVGTIPASSAGGRPIRLESTAPLESLRSGASRPILLLGGALDNDWRSLQIAEHLRRLAHVQSPHVDRPVITIDSLNPDGVADAAPRNEVDVDIARDLAADSPRSAEAQLGRRFVDDLAPRLVVGVRGRDHRSGAQYRIPDDRAPPEALRASGLSVQTRPLAPPLEYCLETGHPVLQLDVHEHCGEGRRAPETLMSPSHFGHPLEAMLSDM